MNLEHIGFYTLSDERALNSSAGTPLWRCELILTDRCNFNCKYCRSLRSECTGDLSYEQAYSTVDFWISEKLKNVRFSGGEPTLRMDLLIALVARCRKGGVERIAVSTNGSASYHDYLDLIEAGVNDFSISFDACCADTVHKMSKCGITMYDRITENICKLSKLTYVTTGIVLTEDNMDMSVQTIIKSHELGVADIRIIPAAQYGKMLDMVGCITDEVLLCHPILKYRVDNIINRRSVRGDCTCDRCWLVLDDMIVAGDYHFPCVIYMREGGDPIGKVGNTTREERENWMINHNPSNDPICRNMCLDVCQDFNHCANRRKDS